MRSKTKKSISILVGIWTFLLLLIFKVIFSTPAYAFLSSLDACAANPECAAIVGSELSPAVAAPTAEAAGTAGHARSKHGISKQVQADILNNPERIFSGRNENGRDVDIYYQDDSVVITEAGKKDSVITAYGKASQKGKANPVNPEKWAKDPNYVEIKIDGPDQVIYPDEERFKLRDWP